MKFSHEYPLPRVTMSIGYNVQTQMQYQLEDLLASGQFLNGRGLLILIGNSL